MEIRVKKAVGSADKTTTTLDLTAGLKLPEAVKSRIKSDVGDFLVEQIVKSAGQAKSPVAGESWKAKLSEKYAAKKKSEGLPTKANMEFEGDYLDSLTYQETKDGIELGWFGDQAGKADGHNNLSGDSSLPQRRVLPDVGQKFIAPIQNELEKIVADSIADEVSFDKSDFDGVESKGELYSTLGEYFPDMSRSEIKVLISRTPALADLLDELDLLRLL